MLGGKIRMPWSVAATTAAAVLFAVMLLAVLVPQAQAAFPGRNGALLVAGKSSRASGECSTDGPVRIVGRVADDAGFCSEGRSAWLVGPDPAGLRLLWSPRTEYAPRYISTGGFSADGRNVVLGESGVGAMFLVAARPGSRARKLSWGGSSPAWLPDGRISFTAGNYQELFVSRPMGRRRVLSYRREGARWSSAGRYAYIGPLLTSGGEYRGKGLLVVSRTRGEREGPLGADGFDWAPSGRSLVVTMPVTGKGRALFVVGLDGGIRRRLTTFVSDDKLAEPRWSPDGRLIAFRRGGEVFDTSALAGTPQGPAAWRAIVRGSESLIDWQPLPAGSQR